MFSLLKCGFSVSPKISLNLSLVYVKGPKSYSSFFVKVSLDSPLIIDLYSPEAFSKFFKEAVTAPKLTAL